MKRFISSRWRRPDFSTAHVGHALGFSTVRVGSTTLKGMTQFSGIPAVLIDPLRSALASAGYPRETINDAGDLNPAGFLAGTFDTIEFRSAVTPTIHINTQELLQPDYAPPNPFVKWLQPTVILRGKGGETAIAPFGTSSGGTVFPVLLAVAAVLGIGFVLGRATA